MLTFEEWLKLTVEDRCKKYKDLSDDDKFKVRQGHYYNEPSEKSPKEEINIPNFLKDEESTRK